MDLEGLTQILSSINDRIRARRRQDFRVPDHQFDSSKGCRAFIMAMKTSGVPTTTLRDDIDTLWRILEVHQIPEELFRSAWDEITVRSVMSE